ncbi:cobalt transport protein CbiM precursor [Methanobrevibacter cuticularis]|uniref:Cobalt transport protein CbiM n=1 Tax=Methanobrevibacter cuticularis TaxID=47311 RepID=A0A166EPL1_9EURY|nr:ECF transporter S component [Methanobrevibacter cuticularis]KZX16873.1 cobalt transport protein CbiM precursor [Methanobrevibacter cuticularis]
MHLPDGIIPLDQAVIYWIISLIAIGIFFFRLSKHPNQKDRRLILSAILAAATIVASSITIPSPFGIPMHFFIIPLVVIILGPFNGTLITFLSLIVQTLIGLGGFTVVGANVLVMGVVLPLATYACYKAFYKFNESLAIFLGTFLGILAATIAQIVVLIIADASDLQMLILTLLPFYLFIGIIEGFITNLIISFIRNLKGEILTLDKI